MTYELLAFTTPSANRLKLNGLVCHECLGNNQLDSLKNPFKSMLCEV